MGLMEIAVGALKFAYLVFIWLILLWGLAWIGKKITEHKIKNNPKWKRKEEYQEMKNRYGKY